MGNLQGIATFEGLLSAIDKRISDYRGYFSLNKDLPKEVLETRTEIGDPLSEIAGILKGMRYISEKTNIIAVIDQLEEVASLVTE